MISVSSNIKLGSEKLNVKSTEVERRLITVAGDTYRYRRYLKSIGLQWNPKEHWWHGRVTRGRIWFLRTKLRLNADEEYKRRLVNSMRELFGTTEIKAIKTATRSKSQKADNSCHTAIEQYSAVRFDSVRKHKLTLGKSINERRCYWGCELCENCLECVSNIDENDRTSR